MQLRGGSAEALTELSASLDGASDDPRLGEELFGVAGVLRAEPALRRVATDSSVEGDAKAGLVGNVFGSAVGGSALGLVQDAVRKRWTSARDLADVLEHLAVTALVRSAGEDASRISDELFDVRRLVEQHPDLRTALSDPARSASDKGALLRRLLEGKVLPATLLLVEQAASGQHGAIDQALAQYQHTAAQAKGETIATVRTARPLSEADQRRLAEALSQQYDTTVHLQVAVDRRLVGGLRVEIGDDVIDGSVSAKLEDAQRRLAG